MVRRSIEVADDTHLDMWRHYEGSRHQKNGNFVTANSLLVGLVAFAGKDAKHLIPLVAILGMWICGAWFLQLMRNSAYIKHHRDLVQADWAKPLPGLASRRIDAALPLGFGGFFAVLLAIEVVGLVAARS